MRLKRTALALVLGLAAAAASLAADPSPIDRQLQLAADSPKVKSARKGLWRASAAILGAVTVADVQSSWGRREANPLLAGPNGRFGSQGVAIKGGLVAGALVFQHFLIKRNPRAATASAIANFGVAAATGAVVVRNHNLR